MDGHLLLFLYFFTVIFFDSDSNGVYVHMNMSQTFVLKADNYSNKMFPLEHNSCVNTSKDFASSKSLNLSTRKEQKTSGSYYAVLSLA